MSGRLVRVAALLLTAAPFFGFVCGNRLPFLRNTSARPIHVASVLSDGRTYESDLSPGAQVVLSVGPDGPYPKLITITFPDGRKQTFTRQTAPGLIGDPIPGGIIGWEVTDDDLRPLPRDRNSN